MWVPLSSMGGSVHHGGSDKPSGVVHWGKARDGFVVLKGNDNIGSEQRLSMRSLEKR